MSRAISARLHVLLAREGSTAVVIRRGPSKHVAMFGWDRKTDRFRLGQWIYGRIYERRCDLSPDGKMLLYFAMNGRWSSETKGAWSAISHAPYLKAVSLWAKGDCWHGGGLFLSSKEYWLNDGYGHELLRDQSGLKRLPQYPWHEAYGGECLGVYYIRLQRDGWIMRQTVKNAAHDAVTIFEKRISDRWMLRKLAHATMNHPVGRGCYFDEHELCDVRSGVTKALPTWEWADVDGGRLVWAESGSLYCGRVSSKGLGRVSLLHDFSGYQFEKIAAPY